MLSAGQLSEVKPVTTRKQLEKNVAIVNRDDEFRDVCKFCLSPTEVELIHQREKVRSRLLDTRAVCGHQNNLKVALKAI